MGPVPYLLVVAPFWRIFDIFLDFAYFNAISIDFYALNCFICIDFV